MNVENIKLILRNAFLNLTEFDKLWKRLIIFFLIPLILCIVSLGFCLWYFLSAFDIVIYGPLRWIIIGKHKNFFDKNFFKNK